MFAKVIVFIHNHPGQNKFNQIRGKLIALHPQTIT